MTAAERAFQEMNNATLDDQVIAIVYVESKDQHDRGDDTQIYLISSKRENIIVFAVSDIGQACITGIIDGLGMYWLRALIFCVRLE